MKKYFTSLFLIIVVSILLVPRKSIANLLGNYKTPKKAVKVDQRRVVGSGSRSQCQPLVEAESIELMVPEEEIAHKTLSSRPSLYIYSRHLQAISVEFNLINLINLNTMLTESLEVVPGITKVKLPKTIKLQDKTLYSWNIAIPCKNNQDNYQSVLNAAIEKVSISSFRGDRSQSKVDLINFYNENGIWYESVDLALELAETSKQPISFDNEPKEVIFWKGLLDLEN